MKLRYNIAATMKLRHIIAAATAIAAAAVPFVASAHTAAGNIECRKGVGVAWGVQWDNFPADNPARQDGKWPYVVKVDGQVVASGLLPGVDHNWSGDDGTPIDENLDPTKPHTLTWDGTYPGTQGQDSSKACQKPTPTTTTTEAPTTTAEATTTTAAETTTTVAQETTTVPQETTTNPAATTVPGGPTTTLASSTTAAPDDNQTTTTVKTVVTGGSSGGSSTTTIAALPSTGPAEAVPFIIAGAAALAGGAVLVLVARRRGTIG